MAQGFVEQVKGAAPEEVADHYLMELISRNMLQVILKNHYGRPKACKMHDVIREIALSISREEKFCDVYDGNDEVDRENGTHHLSIQRNLKSDQALPNLRSFLVFPSVQKNIAMPSGFKLLRALDLEDSPIEKLPNELGDLFNLRYLNLTRTQVKELPKSFQKLQYLESLNAKHTRIQKLPASISKLLNLRHLIMFRRNYGYESTWCYIAGIEAPKGISKLEKLQVLDCINAEYDFVKKLKSLTQLTRISLVKVRKDYGNDLCIALENMKSLRFLALTAADEDKPLNIDALSSAAGIERLFLSGKLEKVPCWFKTLHSITYLGLRWSRLSEDVIPHLQELPNLVWLSLYNSYQGNSLCFHEGYQNLKVLEITKFPDLEEIKIQKGTMPGLQKLYIRACNGIKAIPHGVEFLTDLQDLHLTIVSNELVERIRGSESIDRPKVQHIPDIKHYFRTENGSFYESLS